MGRRVGPQYQRNKIVNIFLQYLTGDVRTNQNPGLAILQIILLREHNRIADVLQHLNPHWDDELTFQESRRINIAQYQHISYYEWLPIFLGEFFDQKISCLHTKKLIV